MKIIDIKKYNTRFPKGNDKYFASLDELKKQEYLSLYSLYSDWLLKYLIEKYRLSMFDESFIESDNNFQVVDLNDMDLYQYLSSDYLKYFYLRNNLYLERLNEEEYKYLLDNLNNSEYNQDKRDFINKTYIKVVVEGMDKKVINVNYGPDNLRFYKPNNALIIGFRYNDFDEGLTKEIHFKRKTFIEANIEIMERLLNKNSEIPIYIVHYNEFSIKK